VHLAAGAHRLDPPACLRRCGENLADRGDDAVPPVRRTLLGPAEAGHDLIVLARRHGDDPAGSVDHGGAHAARADIDREARFTVHAACSRPVNLRPPHYLTAAHRS
jgi:hypothetical protein